MMDTSGMELACRVPFARRQDNSQVTGERRERD
jgi:hypothetical protein